MAVLLVLAAITLAILIYAIVDSVDKRYFKKGPQPGDTRIIRRGECYIIQQYVKGTFRNTWQDIPNESYGVDNVNNSEHNKMRLLETKARVRASVNKEKMEAERSRKKPVTVYQSWSKRG